MVSKNQIKVIRSLQQKKYRKQHQLFFAEGKKIVEDLIRSGIRPVECYVTGKGKISAPASLIKEVSFEEMKKMSALITPTEILAIFKIPEPEVVENKGLIVGLDDIRDPGNLGTIIRLCDWFGVRHLVCSPNTVDAYNPKVVQATMGSLARVNVVYQDLDVFLKNISLPVYGAYMEGTSVYEEVLPEDAVLLMGNEANGISQAIEKKITKKITIPRFGDLQQTESLNVATATAVLLSEFRRGS